MRPFHRYFAAVLCLLIILASAFSVTVLSEHSGHDCSGDHCKVCVKIVQAEALIGQIKAAVLAFIFSIAALLMAVLFTQRHGKLPSFHTPVTLKIQLNN